MEPVQLNGVLMKELCLSLDAHAQWICSEELFHGSAKLRISIRDFDVIHVLDEGKIVSSGDYDYLIKNSDLFRKLSDSELN